MSDEDTYRTSSEYIRGAIQYTADSFHRVWVNRERKRRSSSEEGDTESENNDIQGLQCIYECCGNLCQRLVELCPDIDDDEGRQFASDAFHGALSGKDGMYPNPVDMVAELEGAYNEVDDLQQQIIGLDGEVADATRSRDEERECRLKVEAELQISMEQRESLRSELEELQRRSADVLPEQQLAQQLDEERRRRVAAETKLNESEADLKFANSSVRILTDKSNSDASVKDMEIRMLRRTIADQRGTIVQLKYLIEQKKNTTGHDVASVGDDENDDHYDDRGDDSSVVEIIDDDSSERDSLEEEEDAFCFSSGKEDASAEADKGSSDGFPRNINRNLPCLRLRLDKDRKAYDAWGGLNMNWSEIFAILLVVMKWTPEKKRNGKPGVKRREFQAAFVVSLSFFITFGIAKVPNEFKIESNELAKVGETIKVIVQEIDSAGCEFAHGNAKALADAAKEKARGIGDMLKNKRLKGVDSDSQKALYEKIYFVFNDKKKVESGKAG